MKKGLCWLFLLILSSLVLPACQEKKAAPESIDLSSYFSEYTGTFVLIDLNNNELKVHNQTQADKRLSPCSTFKLLNALIGLQTGAVKDENTIKKWDGTQYPIEEWNQDHTLASAMKNSVVWYYQAMARDIGEDKMKSYVAKTGYGNNDISSGLDKFWLDGSLQISAMEEAQFVKRLYKNDLPFDKDNITRVKSMATLKSAGGVTLVGKTGSGSKLGWFVGYVNKADKTYIFAANIEGKKASGSNAKQIVEKILKDMQVLPPKF